MSISKSHIICPICYKRYNPKKYSTGMIKCRKCEIEFSMTYSSVNNHYITEVPGIDSFCYICLRVIARTKRLKLKS